MYIGARSSSVIYYVMVNEDVKDRIIDFKVVRVNPNHLLLWLKIRQQEEEEEENLSTEAEQM